MVFVNPLKSPILSKYCIVAAAWDTKHGNSHPRAGFVSKPSDNSRKIVVLFPFSEKNKRLNPHGRYAAISFDPYHPATQIN
jgi:hypothetical protein